MSLTEIGAVILAFVLGALGLWAKGRRSANVDHQVEELEGYVETRTRMDEIGRTSDADAAREWLHDRGEPKRPVRRNKRSKN